MLNLIQRQSPARWGDKAGRLDTVAYLNAVPAVVNGEWVTPGRFPQPVPLPLGHATEPVLANFGAYIHASKHTSGDARRYTWVMISTSEQRTALYRFYGTRENLLYVGISNDPWRRWREHVYDKSWYSQVKHQAVTWYETEAQARGAETRAIRAERPQFNVAGAIRPPEARRRIDPSVVTQVCAVWISVPGLLAGAAAVVALNVPLHSRAAFFAHVLAWAAAVVLFTLPAPVAFWFLARSAPLVYRFACWLDRNFGEQRWRQATVGAKARREQGIPGSAWILAPWETFRVRRRMRTVGPRNYWQAWEEERRA